MSRERWSERRRIAHRRSRSLSFNSQSFDTAVPGCPRVVRKILRIVFIQVRGRRVQPPRTVSISLPLPLRLGSLTAPPSKYRRRFFLAFETGSGARTMVFEHRATGRSTRKRSHRSRSNGGNRAVSFVPRGSFRASCFREKSYPRSEPFLPAKPPPPPPRRNLLPLRSPTVAFLVNRYDGLS